MVRDTLPGAGDRAVALIADIVEGRWDAARRDLADKLRDSLDAGRLGGGLARVAGMVGAFERMGEPLAYPVGNRTVVDIPLYFEAGERTGRVSFDPDGKIVGLFILPAAT
jgi:hypothetical protein